MIEPFVSYDLMKHRLREEQQRRPLREHVRAVRPANRGLSRTRTRVAAGLRALADRIQPAPTGQSRLGRPPVRSSIG